MMKPAFRSLRPALLLGAAALAAGGCRGGKVKPAPDPRRPEPTESAAAEEPRKEDCEPTRSEDELPALKYAERSIEEAENLADEGFSMLRRSEQGGVARSEKEKLIRGAVRRFITALHADPYNVHATYNLSAAYARIGRGQCAVNLLERLAALRELPSQRPRVEKKLDRLFGRGAYEGRLDPDFFELRDDPRFRRVSRKLQ